MILLQKNSTILVFSIISFFLLPSFVCSFYPRKTHEFFGVAIGIENVPSSSLMNERQFLIILNKARKDSLLEPLMIDKDLSRAARYHSYDMGTQNYFGHDTYDRNIITDSLEFVCDVHARTKNFLKYESKNKVWKVSAGVSENCCFRAASGKEAFISWLNSPPHCKNMFNPDHRLVGIGYVHIPGSKKPHCWTTDFSR